jgi:ABC-2 type transport system ATP-binding protein
MPDALSSRDLYATAAEFGVLIRRIQLRRDSLEDIFLRAMEYEGGRVDHVGV